MLECFNCYHSYLKSVELLTDAEVGRLFRALLQYSATGESPELRGNEKFIFPMIKEQIDRDRTKYQEKCDKNREIANSRWANANAYERIRTDTTECERIRTDANNKDKDNNKDNNKNKDKIYSADPLLNDAMERFVKHRKAIKSPMTDNAIELMIKHLNKMTPDVREQVAIINQSIENGWKGIFPLKEESTSKKSKGGSLDGIIEWGKMHGIEGLFEDSSSSCEDISEGELLAGQGDSGDLVSFPF